jgi:hypothetical protein
MVFYLDGKALVGSDVARAFSDGPALEDAIPSQSKIVMQTGSRVFLDDERKGLGLGRSLFASGAGATTGFGGDLKVAHLAVTCELAIDGV